ncbi:hypothetical protein JW721_04055 [Candidatus Micrarchaeota archaeon]|nr:hypothetical protein [Candidatus Micrarchaeota archaeon]
MALNNEVLIVPQKHLLNGELFRLEGKHRREDKLPWVELRKELRKEGLELKTIDQSDDACNARAVVFIEVPSPRNRIYRFCLENRMQERLFFMAYEPQIIHPPNHNADLHSEFKAASTFNNRLVDGRKYFKHNFTLPIRHGDKISLPRGNFGKKKLLCLISSNKYSHRKNELYSERIRAIRFMERNHPADFDLYGVGWDMPVIHLPLASMLPVNAAIQRFYPVFPSLPRFSSYPSYRGVSWDKAKLFPNYKFTIAYENELGSYGYVSEKILEAMLYGCVPVYLGERQISSMVPAGCFVDKRSYSDYRELYEYLSCVDECEHAGYLENIERFLNSKKAYPFTIDAFIESFSRMLNGGSA